MDKQKEIEKMAADLDKAKELALGTVGSLNNGFGGWYAKCLVEKGYGDVREAEHRAEVAERALLTACVNLIKDKEDNVNMELLARVVYTNYLREAEKELAEEMKDD